MHRPSAARALIITATNGRDRLRSQGSPAHGPDNDQVRVALASRIAVEATRPPS